MVAFIAKSGIKPYPDMPRNIVIPTRRPAVESCLTLIKLLFTLFTFPIMPPFLLLPDAGRTRTNGYPHCPVHQGYRQI
jgi:hypothetical protein